MPVWSKNSSGLKWQGLGFCTGSLFEWAFATQRQRLQSRFHENYGLQGNLRCFGRACSPMSPEH